MADNETRPHWSCAITASGFTINATAEFYRVSIIMAPFRIRVKTTRLRQTREADGELDG